MKISFLDGRSLARKLHDLCHNCSQLDIAMAYVKIGGLRTLLRNTDELVKRNVSIRIVFGLSSRQGITDKESAQELLNLSREKKIIVKKWNNWGFHPKLLIFHGNHQSIVVGSSNLTEAAQSSNAEANVLVEDADSQLIAEAEAFFERYFNPAPILNQQHVEAYKPRTYDRETNTYVGPKEDNLPSPAEIKHSLEDFKPKSVWKIAPGKNARYWRSEWLKLIDDDGEGYIAIGWDEAGDLDRFQTYESLTKAVKHAAETDWDVDAQRKTKIKYATDQLWMFKTGISVGDGFIVYSRGRVLGVAQVTPNSRHHFWAVKKPDMTYGYQMNVNYLWYSPWPGKAADKVTSVLGSPPIDTLRKVDSSIWELVVKNLP